MTAGMNFGMDGPQVNGWWYNPSTGDRFNAIDTYFEDNNLLIKTSDGRLLNYNQIQNYLRVDDPKSIPDKPKMNNSPVIDDSIPDNILAEIGEIDDNNDILIPEDDIYGINNLKIKPSVGLENTNNHNSLQSTNTPSIATQNLSIITRALNGKELPKITNGICWKHFPKREIEMLIDVMQISEDEITQYYIDNIQLDDIKKILSESITQYIADFLHSDGATKTQNKPKISTSKKKKE